MSQLFGMDRTVVVRHIRNIYKDEELQEETTCAKNAQVQNEGGRMVKRTIPYYNLDMIISVGYRINYLVLHLLFQSCHYLYSLCFSFYSSFSS